MLMMQRRLFSHFNGSYIMEPFKIKSIEPIKLTTKEERQELLGKAGYNLFQLRAEDVLIDLLTDSGTSAMSTYQWASMHLGDDSYAGSRSWFRFQDQVKSLTGFKYVVPAHQGRAAERILFSSICKPEHVVPSNSHFDTTRANIEVIGAEAVDLLCKEGKCPSLDAPFKGNMDVAALDALLARSKDRVPLVMMTVTNNTGGGQPVSLDNMRQVSERCSHYQIPFYLDACRFAENAWLIKQREAGQGGRRVEDIAREMFSLADGCTMSAKKDGLSNIGGFLCTNDPGLYQQEKNLLIISEGFPTYGGLAGRDLEATAVGLQEVLDERYLGYRVGQIEYLADRFEKAGVPIVRPAGGHAVFIDAAAFLSHIPRWQYPGQSLAIALYLESGIRSCEIGSVMFGKPNPTGEHELPSTLELVRLAIPRRVYTQSHLDYVIDAVIKLYQHRQQLQGIKIIEASPHLRHFTAKFQPFK